MGNGCAAGTAALVMGVAALQDDIEAMQAKLNATLKRFHDAEQDCSAIETEVVDEVQLGFCDEPSQAHVIEASCTIIAAHVRMCIDIALQFSSPMPHSTVQSAGRIEFMCADKVRARMHFLEEKLANHISEVLAEVESPPPSNHRWFAAWEKARSFFTRQASADPSSLKDKLHELQNSIFASIDDEVRTARHRSRDCAESVSPICSMHVCGEYKRLAL